MSIQKTNVLKLCSFYVSDWHIVTMLLPYINNEINKETKIIPILENSIQKNVQTLVNKLNLKNRKKILEINWSANKGIKYSNINETLKESKNKALIIIVNGSKQFIKATNQNIERFIKKNNVKTSIKIINAYEVTEFNGSIQDILDNHDKILNTSGEKEISEVFEGYVKNKKIENTK